MEPPSNAKGAVMRRPSPFLLGMFWVITGLPLVAAAGANDPWPRFRGPNGAATASDQGIPTEWSPSQVRWKVELDGVGNSSPIVWGDHLFVTGSSDEGKKRNVMAFDVATGKLRWKREFSFETHSKHGKNSYATATPTTDGERVYSVFTDAGHLQVFAQNFDGSPAWQKDLGAFVTDHGSGGSPIVVGDMVVVANEQDGPSFIVAFDGKTGAERWRAPRPTKLTSYTTPFVCPTPKGDVIVNSSTAGIVALDPRDGSVVWNCEAFEKRTVGSPLFAAGLVLAHSGSGSRGDQLVAIRPEATGKIEPSALAWKQAKSILPYCVTPLAVGDLVFMVTDAPGVARCIEAKTGKEVWTSRLEGNFFASPICIDGRIFAVGEKGDVFVLGAETKYRLFARNKLDDYFLATPAVSGGRLFLRGEKQLWCVSAQ